MRAIKLVIKNIGIIENETIDINKPLMLFYGEIKQGKSTVLNSVKWVMGGAFPADIIRHGAEEGMIALYFDVGSITREFYRAKDGGTKARDIVFIRNGAIVKQPVNEIKKLLNPFLLDQNYLINMSGQERSRYFVELLGVDTKDEDTKITDAMTKASILRANIKAYGAIDLTEVKPVDTTAILKELDFRKKAHQAKHNTARREIEAQEDVYAKACEQWQHKVDEATAFNRNYEEHERAFAVEMENIKRLEQQLDEARNRLFPHNYFLGNNKKMEAPAKPRKPDMTECQTVLEQTCDTSDLEQQLAAAGAMNAKYEAYKANVYKAAQKQAAVETLAALEEQQRKLKEAKVAKLATISASCGIAGLAFDESGDFTFEGTSADMLSTSQLMKLSELVKSLYPEGFGLDLIDRAESLGASIFEYVDQAKAGNRTILATIVGDRPAEAPAEVGVFVVAGGKISQ